MPIMKPAIRVENLSKLYEIGEVQQPYRTLRDTVSDNFLRPFRAFRRKSAEEREATSIWALKDLTFEIGQGEVVGIIGRNGAGKSTLLKVLSRITEPTTGCADIYGRVGTLLEVGTGFHNELTGRENIYLNGAILGMKRADIQRQFDAIVAFAEVEKFVDTPVKHYSSGMYLRLAFAVAAHLEPEILLVDEVLAVGDIAFQKKCLGKMGDVARQGRTILFVSHNMGAVRSLCEKGVVLNAGQLLSVGDIASSIETYHTLVAAGEKQEDAAGARRGPGFSHVKLEHHEGSTIQQSDPIELGVTLNIAQEVAGFTIVAVLDDMNQRRILHLRYDSTELGQNGGWLGSWRLRLKLPPLWLEPGLYTLYFKANLQGAAVTAKLVSDVFHLDVGGKSCGWNSVLSPDVVWDLEPVEVSNHAEVSLA
jgi:lipopolysaccharide transport system ATP-binding protein